MTLENLTILYAEDEQAIQETVSDVLELYVHRVITASNGEEALEMYNLYNPSILLLDICMPLKDGLQVLKEIRKTDLTTPVIIMTAHTEQPYLLDAVELYITKYIIKPFDKTALLGALNECLKVLSKKINEHISLTSQIEYSPQQQTIYKEDNEIKLNKKEALLLNLLIKHAPNFVSYEQIEYHLWDDIEVSKEAFRSLIKDLRKKTSKEFIQNISGTGYRVELY